ncbi:type VII secretion-associated protein [Mycolicibacter sp. MYC123]|uniref:Type VII secretion-associated protein n=1 Tax=[Mycobacterium] zoologicum TaxID=2872311 RepID=A0ABU5YKE2_9MYCO|nr:MULTISPECIES: type VII secretion-associated protein [unclassified Mycolicibacter]MEB3050518.1 type VII secretion-associated protein [Mycolicibacter sp. MYC123]MEB3063006.1 type VII secretion-associated protein [Mycolicibacter sp. MYC101]
MSHRAVIEAGPATIRRLCCAAVESEGSAAALEWIDDPVALVDGQPRELPELLRSVMTCPESADSIEIIHPSWWPARRVQLFAATAEALADHVTTRPRSQLHPDAVVVVEIADALVAITGAGTVAEPRIGAPDNVAEAVARRVRDQGAVVIDAPVSVGGAAALATMIAERLPGAYRIFDELPVSAPPSSPPVPQPPEPARTGRRSWMPPAAAAAALGVVALGLRMHHDAPPDPMTYLVEGRVAVQVPAGWPVRRVNAGPGSPRVEVVSPTDPRLVLHLTQAPAAGDTLAAVAEPLQRALQRADAETPGVFTGFDAADSRAGRPAITYREIRDGREVDWAVLVDDGVRIGIGCQTGPGGADPLRAVCEQAVRSAHALG